MSTISNQILSIMRRRQVKGLTVGEIFDRLCNQSDFMPVYSSVRARVYELADSGKLTFSGVRKDIETGRTASTHTRKS